MANGLSIVDAFQRGRQQRQQLQLGEQQLAQDQARQQQQQALQGLLGQVQAGQQPVQPLGGQGPRLPVEQQQAQGTQALARLSIQFPEQFEQINQNLGLITQQQKDQAADFAFDLQNTPFEQRQAKIQQRARTLQAEGRNASDTLSLLELPVDQQDQALQATQVAALSPAKRLELAQKGPGGLASAKTEILSDGSTIQALPSGTVQVRNPAGEIVTGQDRLDVLKSARGVEIDQEQAKADIAVQTEARKAAAKAGVTLKTKPEIEAAVTEAVGKIKADVEAIGDQKSNEATLNLYSTAMKGLVDGLSGTDTGPFVGLLPALTANQQIAEGAIAAMAPVLKQLFRGAGEGTFTDKDQELLLKMVPTRADSEKARQSKIQNIDSIVRAKLGQGQAETPKQVLRFDAQGNLIQ